MFWEDANCTCRFPSVLVVRYSFSLFDVCCILLLRVNPTVDLTSGTSIPSSLANSCASSYNCSYSLSVLIFTRFVFVVVIRSTVLTIDIPFSWSCSDRQFVCMNNFSATNRQTMNRQDSILDFRPDASIEASLLDLDREFNTARIASYRTRIL